MTKRGYSREFTPHPDAGRVKYHLDRIPASLWIKVRAKAKREGISLRALILGWCQEWVTRPSGQSSAEAQERAALNASIDQIRKTIRPRPDSS